MTAPSPEPIPRRHRSGPSLARMVRTLGSAASRRATLVIGAALVAGTATVVAVAIVAAPSGTAANAGSAGSPAAGSSVGGPQKTVTAQLTPQPLGYLGALEPNAPATYAGVDTFGQAIGRTPNLAMYYSGWYEKFQTAFADSAAAKGAFPVVEVDPTHISLTAISEGVYDTYLDRFADQVAAYKRPVVISFGHEMNGDWFTWGYQTTDPATFVAAWRHVVNVFRSQGADNVTWMWTVNSPNHAPDNLCAWWPGSQYVTWVGLDSYYYNQTDTFGKLFDPDISEVRKCSNKPILITETAAGQLSGRQRAVRNLFSAIRAGGYLGFIWFDKNQNKPPFHQAWRLETDPPAVISTFRQEASGWQLVRRYRR
jgi:mannan endo-1,4-beta-mannosidase